MEIDEAIEKIKILKSELDSAFNEGRIDLDRISAGLESVVVDLESISDLKKQEDHRREIERRPSVRIEDYR